MEIDPTILKRMKVEPDSHEFQIVGKEMSKHFKQNIWWLFHRYPLALIKDAFIVCQKQEVYTIAYIVAVIHNLK